MTTRVDEKTESPLLALAERCEQAIGRCTAIDNDIANALMLPLDWGMSAERYTASIDAALTLVPEGWNSGHDTFKAVAWVRYIQDGLECARYVAYASTPALAICAAALRARLVP